MLNTYMMQNLKILKDPKVDLHRHTLYLDRTLDVIKILIPPKLISKFKIIPTNISAFGGEGV